MAVSCQWQAMLLNIGVGAVQCRPIGFGSPFRLLFRDCAGQPSVSCLRNVDVQCSGLSQQAGAHRDICYMSWLIGRHGGMVGGHGITGDRGRAPVDAINHAHGFGFSWRHAFGVQRVRIDKFCQSSSELTVSGAAIDTRSTKAVSPEFGTRGKCQQNHNFSATESWHAVCVVESVAPEGVESVKGKFLAGRGPRS